MTVVPSWCPDAINATQSWSWLHPSDPNLWPGKLQKICENLNPMSSIHSSIYLQYMYKCLIMCIYIYMCVCVCTSIHPSIHPPTHPPIHPPESLKPHHPSAKPWIIGRFLQGFPSLAASPRRRAAAREDPSLHRWRSVQRIRDQGSGQKVEDIMVLEMLDPQVTHSCDSILQWSNDLGDLGVLPF